MILSQLEFTHCYLCGENNTKFLYPAKGFRDDTRLFKVVRCNHCGLVYINPRYCRQENDFLYNEVYYTAEAVDPSGKARSFLSDRKKKIRDHKVEIGYLKKYKSTGRILDFGSAVGFFLEALDESWDKYAVDISEFAINNIRLESVHKFLGTLAEAGFSPGFFDVIYVGHTLDRLIEVKENIRELKRILKPDGIIVIILPNIGSFCARIFKQNYRLLYSNHLIYFSKQSISNFLNESGLKVIDIKYPFYGTSFFSWRRLPSDLLKILSQFMANSLGIKTRIVSPPFRGNIMSIIAKRKDD